MIGVLILIIALPLACSSDASDPPADAVRHSCHAKCDPIPTWTRFEECLRTCYSQNHVSNDTSTSASITTPTTTIAITSTASKTKNASRQGFYLSFLPVGERCEPLFPGFYTHNIPKDAGSWEIPAHLPGLQPLTIDYGCTYRVELRSKPYPYGDPKYTLVEKFEVPSCVDGYCSCKNQRKLQSPADVNFEFSVDKAKITWHYNTSMENSNAPEKSHVQFRVMLADLFRKPTIAPWKKLFKWRPWNATVLADQNRSEYEAELPNLKDGLEYKLQIFTMNEHMCKSEPIEREFIFTLSTTSTAAPTSPEPKSTTTGYTVTATPINETHAHASTQISIDQNHTTSTEADLEKTTHAISVETVKPSYSRDEYFLMAFLPIIVILCLIITAFAACKFYASRKQKLIKKQQYFERLVQFPWTLLTHASTSPSMETNILYTEKEIIDARARGLADEYEISYERLSLGRVIGQGAFGLVYLGTAIAINNVSGMTQVAIKQLKANADERERFEFLEEIAIMKKVGHHTNIVNMYGCCTLQYPHCMVMEYVPYGDLLHYLRNLRKEFEKQIEEYRLSLERDYIMQLNTHPLMTHAEINAAVRSLINSNSGPAGTGFYCNQDMASVYEGSDGYPIPFADADPETDLPTTVPSSAQHDLQQLTYSLDAAELQSFAYQVACGMHHLEDLNITHRDLAARNILVGHGKTLKISDFGLSRMGIYVKTTSGRIPLRWLSIEAMRDHTYSTKSDAWAYGTVLWEICTLGGFPYPTVADKDLLRYLESGNRLGKPASCSDAIYRLMLNCWSHSPHNRPSFDHIKRKLNEMNKHASPYVEFSPGTVAVDLLPPQEYCKISPLAGIQSNQSAIQGHISLAIDNDSYVPQ